MTESMSQLGYAAWAHTYVAMERDENGEDSTVSWNFADACHGELDPDYVSPHNETEDS